MPANTSSKMGWKPISTTYSGDIKSLPTKGAYSYSITNMGTATFYLDNSYPVEPNQAVSDSGPRDSQCTHNTKISWMKSQGSKEVLFRAMVPSEWPETTPIPNC